MVDADGFWAALEPLATYLSGHTWQVTYVRGAYSRAFGTDKRVFDPM